MIFKLICIFYDFKALLLENRLFSDFETCFIGFSIKNRFRNISNFFYAESNEAGLKVRKIMVFKQQSFEVIEYAN